MFRNAVYSCVFIWGSLPILTVSVVFTSDTVTIQICDVSLCCLLLCSYMGRLSILTVSVILTSDPVTIQMCKVSLSCVQLCSYMGKIVHLDGFTCINPESCHHTDVQRCVVKCTVVQLYGEGCPF
jgi:hypothetical protein